ncbi:mycofactocin biosynthesis peptidyl-dipeptidase MftE [Gordonia rubripertincta]|uniref:Mycofactocin biosynthesis peptidyl-dipeptidase MftE n=1 Tax=Gordonia rubripertincta TaxID=36822 RepID=A0ABT4N247_GORRU|nr:mycofactocin biosynthesis peptidyl-dipeptidase MftE [Gordonia rubripertincta]MCZ4553349.1 mycofactocin biosynthesis peptidyl-dipeptidase MftE [Gordonia rubripertincta]
MTSSGGLGFESWTELDGRRVTVIVPVGSIEQHGPHLPLDTDVRIATAVSRAVSEVDTRSENGDGDLLVAPALNYGAAGEHEGFPGTISIGRDVLQSVLVEYGRSACRWAERVVFVNGHGGNGSVLVNAVKQLRYEGRDVAWYGCGAAGGDAHAGFTETSLLLHLSPEVVRQEAMVRGNVAPVSELMTAMRSGGVAAVSGNGVLGDPRNASAPDGRRMLNEMVARLSDALERWQPDAMGMLR